MDRLLRRSEVEAKVGFGKSALYKKMREGSFPHPVNIGSKAVRWRESELLTWMNSRPRAA